MDDRGIVALYWRRDEAALRATEEKYGSYLGKIACQILGDWEDSQECVNDTYLRAWNSMPTQRPAVLSTYLGKIVRGCAIDRFRHGVRPLTGGALRVSVRRRRYPGGGGPPPAG